MKTFDLVVVDALGFTFGFTYHAASAPAARAAFWKKVRSLGKRTNHIRVVSCTEVR